MKRLIKILKWTLISIGILLTCLVIIIIEKSGNFENFMRHFGVRENFFWLMNDTLELSQQDYKCGEWGGDIERIKIFRKSNKLLGYYIKESYNCDELPFGYIYDETNPTNPPTTYEAIPTIYQSKEKEITNQQIRLLKKTIVDLSKYQLNNRFLWGNYGIVNTVELKREYEHLLFKDLYIRDWPSFKWKKFHRLKKKLLK